MRGLELLKTSLITLSALCLVSPMLSAQGVLYVLDNSEDSITAISRNGEILGEVELSGQPERIAISPNGKYLIAFDKGKGFQFKTRWVPEKRSSISVIDSKSLDVASLNKVCWSVSVGGVERGIGVGGAWYFGQNEDNVVILCEATPQIKSGSSLRANKPGLAELLDIDLRTASIRRREEIDRPVTGWINMPDGLGFAVFVPLRETYGKEADQKAEIRFFNGQTLQVEKVLQIDGNPGPPFISADKSNLILFDSGDRKKGSKSKVPGVLHIVSVAQRELLRSIGLGAAPRFGPDIANSQLIVASYLGKNSLDKDPDTSVVHLIKSGQLNASFDVGQNPLSVQSFPEKSRLYSVGAKAFIVTNTADGVSHQIKYKPKMKSFGEMLVNSEHTRVFLLATNAKMGFDLLVIDLESSSIASFSKVGSSGKKFGKIAGAAVLAFGLSSVATSWLPGPSSLGDIGSTVARDMVVQTVIQDVVMMGTLGGAYSDIAFGPDEKFLYAVNQLSRDVTVFDTANLSKGTVIENTGGARHMRLLPESGFLAVLAGDEKLILIDTTTNTVIKERKFGGNFMFLGDGKDAIALSRKTHSVYLLNGETLEVIRSAGGFKNPYQYVLSPD